MDSAWWRSDQCQHKRFGAVIRGGPAMPSCATATAVSILELTPRSRIASVLRRSSLRCSRRPDFCATPAPPSPYAESEALPKNPAFDFQGQGGSRGSGPQRGPGPWSSNVRHAGAAGLGRERWQARASRSASTALVHAHGYLEQGLDQGHKQFENCFKSMHPETLACIRTPWSASARSNSRWRFCEGGPSRSGRDGLVHAAAFGKR